MPCGPGGLLGAWVRDFVARHPAATVVKLGTGLNNRFERVDNGQAHWINLLPLADPIAGRAMRVTLLQA